MYAFDRQHPPAVVTVDIPFAASTGSGLYAYQMAFRSGASPALMLDLRAAFEDVLLTLASGGVRASYARRVLPPAAPLAWERVTLYGTAYVNVAARGVIAPHVTRAGFDKYATTNSAFVKVSLNKMNEYTNPQELIDAAWIAADMVLASSAQAVATRAGTMPSPDFPITLHSPAQALDALMSDDPDALADLGTFYDDATELYHPTIPFDDDKDMPL